MSFFFNLSAQEETAAVQDGEMAKFSQDLFPSQFLNETSTQFFNATQNSQPFNFNFPSSELFPINSQTSGQQFFDFNTQQQTQTKNMIDSQKINFQTFFNEEDNDDDIDGDENMEVQSIHSNNQQTPIKSDSLNESQLSDYSLSNQSMTSECFTENVLPDSIIDLYKGVKDQGYSNWTFISLIAGQLCTDIFPVGVYNNLKLALLISLVSPKSAPLHIIAIGQEISHAKIIMNALGKFSQRFLNVSQNYDGITVKKNDIIEAGPMSLASNGVSFVGNWSRLPAKVAQNFLRQMELGIMIVDKLQKNFPLNTALWSYWSLSDGTKKDCATIDQFLNVFGIPIVFNDQHNEDTIIDDLLDQVTINPPERFNDIHIPERDFQSYIDYASNLSVEFDSDAEIMLRNYFIATKSIRPDTLTEKAYDVLKKFAESLAKLCLRQTVMRQDILVAINICEKFIHLLFDTDSYSSPIEMKATSIEHYDSHMESLFLWYSQFTKDILERL